MKRSWTRWKNKLRAGDPYLVVNLVLGLCFLLVIIYSAVFSPEPDSHPIPCVYTRLTGEACVSCGLSRGLSHGIRGQFGAAAGVNPHSIPVLLFFLFQVGMRLAVSVLLVRSTIAPTAILLTDITLSAVAVALAFLPMLL